ncbi:hypothetical protein [Peribacillus asahii]|uniref:hypothetical protein n=1 Tax=Peribacillus asahii TaxID=228899 RepID=UPI00382B1711
MFRKKTEVMTVSEFLHGKEKVVVPFQTKMRRHVNKYGFVYKVAGVTAIILISGGTFDYAFATSTMMSKSSVDLTVRALYGELIGIGKWIIIFKGGIDIIKSVGGGDFDTAKKSFFSYLMVYLFLLGLPYGMDKVDEVFINIGGEGK